eukprot:jgi/Botrbrau1/10604/Bobra.0358s0023.1
MCDPIVPPADPSIQACLSGHFGGSRDIEIPSRLARSQAPGNPFARFGFKDRDPVEASDNAMAETSEVRVGAKAQKAKRNVIESDDEEEGSLVGTGGQLETTSDPAVKKVDVDTGAGKSPLDVSVDVVYDTEAEESSSPVFRRKIPATFSPSKPTANVNAVNFYGACGSDADGHPKKAANDKDAQEPRRMLELAAKAKMKLAAGPGRGPAGRGTHQSLCEAATQSQRQLGERLEA